MGGQTWNYAWVKTYGRYKKIITTVSISGYGGCVHLLVQVLLCTVHTNRWLVISVEKEENAENFHVQPDK